MDQKRFAAFELCLVKTASCAVMKTSGTAAASVKLRFSGIRARRPASIRSSSACCFAGSYAEDAVTGFPGICFVARFDHLAREFHARNVGMSNRQEADKGLAAEEGRHG